jgi:hypothetical protein
MGTSVTLNPVDCHSAHVSPSQLVLWSVVTSLAWCRGMTRVSLSRDVFSTDEEFFGTG